MVGPGVGLKSDCPGAPERARLGGASFLHRFSDALNEQIRSHCRVIDGLFYLDEGEHPVSELPALSKADFAVIRTLSS